jgi:DNA-binding transcriptional regulator YiaG
VFNNNTSIDTKVAVLEEKLSIYEQMMNKIEHAIDAISETNQNISKMLAIHDQRLEQAVRSDEVIIKMITELKQSMESEDTDLSDRIDEVTDKTHDQLDSINTKIEEIRKIKWMTIGVGVFAAVLATSVSTLASGWLTPGELGYRMEHRYVPAPENVKK